MYEINEYFSYLCCYAFIVHWVESGDVSFLLAIIVLCDVCVGGGAKNPQLFLASSKMVSLEELSDDPRLIDCGIWLLTNLRQIFIKLIRKRFPP